MLGICFEIAFQDNLKIKIHSTFNYNQITIDRNNIKNKNFNNNIKLFKIRFRF